MEAVDLQNSHALHNCLVVKTPSGNGIYFSIFLCGNGMMQ